MASLSANAVFKRAPLFLTSWTAANAEKQASSQTDFVLKNGTTRLNLADAVALLGADIDAITAMEEQRTVNMATRDSLRGLTRAAVETWRVAALYLLGDAPVGANLPTKPDEKDGMDAFLTDLKRVNDRWILMNGTTGVPNFTPPLVLKTGMTQPQFAALILQLETAKSTLETLEHTLPVARAKRDNHANTVYEIFKLYREGVLATFPDTSPVLEKVPTLQPADTGHSPAPVVLTGVINTATGQIDLIWTPSNDPDFDHYEVKLAPGPRYKDDDGVMLAEFKNAAVVNFTVPTQFTPKGATVSCIVSTFLTDNKHKASNSLKFQIPI